LGGRPADSLKGRFENVEKRAQEARGRGALSRIGGRAELSKGEKRRPVPAAHKRSGAANSDQDPWQLSRMPGAGAQRRWRLEPLEAPAGRAPSNPVELRVSVRARGAQALAPLARGRSGGELSTRTLARESGAPLFGRRRSGWAEARLRPRVDAGEIGGRGSRKSSGAPPAEPSRKSHHQVLSVTANLSQRSRLHGSVRQLACRQAAGWARGTDLATVDYPRRGKEERGGEVFARMLGGLQDQRGHAAATAAEIVAETSAQQAG